MGWKQDGANNRILLSLVRLVPPFSTLRGTGERCDGIPVARMADTEDHVRAAAARMVMETIWMPPALLPQFGAVWTQTGPDQAEVRFPDVPGVEPIQMDLDATGRVLEMTTMRWSDANPDRIYRPQPFGGRMLDHATHQGFTIPTAMEIGNLYGTPEYVPFFRARLTQVEYSYSDEIQAAC